MCRNSGTNCSSSLGVRGCVLDPVVVRTTWSVVWFGYGAERKKTKTSAVPTVLARETSRAPRLEIAGGTTPDRAHQHAAVVVVVIKMPRDFRFRSSKSHTLANTFCESGTPFHKSMKRGQCQFPVRSSSAQQSKHSALLPGLLFRRIMTPHWTHAPLAARNHR